MQDPEERRGPGMWGAVWTYVAIVAAVLLALAAVLVLKDTGHTTDIYSHIIDL